MISKASQFKSLVRTAAHHGKLGGIYSAKGWSVVDLYVPTPADLNVARKWLRENCFPYKVGKTGWGPIHTVEVVIAHKDDAKKFTQFMRGYFAQQDWTVWEFKSLQEYEDVKKTMKRFNHGCFVDRDGSYVLKTCCIAGAAYAKLAMPSLTKID